MKSKWLLKGTINQVLQTECVKTFARMNYASLPDGAKNTQVCGAGELRFNGKAVDACQGRFQKNL